MTQLPSLTQPLSYNTSISLNVQTFALLIRLDENRLRISVSKRTHACEIGPAQLFTVNNSSTIQAFWRVKNQAVTLAVNGARIASVFVSDTLRMYVRYVTLRVL